MFRYAKMFSSEKPRTYSAVELLLVFIVGCLLWVGAPSLATAEELPASSSTSKEHDTISDEPQKTDGVEEREEHEGSFLQRLAVSASYYGELLSHPGMTAGVEIYLYENSWYNNFFAGTLGFYVHPRNHLGVFILPSLGQRFTAFFGLFGELLLGVGYLHTWPQGAVYERNDAGEIEQVYDSGHPHLMMNLALGFGWDLRKNGLLPLSIFFRIDAFGEYPFNNIILPHVAAQFGAIYRLE